MKSFSFIKIQAMDVVLKEFKDSFIINDVGDIFNHTVGAMIYDSIQELNTVELDVPEIIFHIDENGKKQLWKESKKGFMIKLWDKEREKSLAELTEEDIDLHKKQREAVIIEIYKTKLVEHLLNVLANNNKFVNLGSKFKLK